METEVFQQRSKFHGPIIGLLFVLLLLSLAAVGLLVSARNSTHKPEDVAAACTAQVEAAVKARADELTSACKNDEEETTTINVPSSHEGVGFDYPTGWSAIVIFDMRDASWQANVVPGYLLSCTECDGPFVDIRMEAGKLTDARVSASSTFEEYVNNRYSDDFFHPNTTITKTPSGTGTLYTVKGELANGMYEGVFETLFFEGNESWAEVQFMDVNEPSPDSVAAWEIVKESLDFSQIK